MRRNIARGGTLVNILALLMALEITALGIFAGYLILSNRIDERKAWLFSQVYEGGITAETLAMADSWQQHKAEEEARRASTPAGAAAPVKLAADVRQQQTAQLDNQWQLQEIKALKRDVEQRLQELRQQREQLEKEQAKLQEQRGAGAPSDEASFRDMLGIMARMKPPALKEVLVQMKDETVVRVLKEMDGRASAKVLAEFRTPDEVEMKRRYLEMIRQGVGESSANAVTANR